MIASLLALALGANLAGTAMGMPIQGGRRASSVVLRLPFNVPGCYANGSTMGTRGETVAITRATTATYVDANNAVQTCASGQMRVGPAGLIVEPARTNAALRNTAIDPATYPAIWPVVGVTAAAPTVTAATADLLAPDGTQTASKIVFPAVAANQASYLSQPFTGTAVAWSGDLWLRTAAGTATVNVWLPLNSTNVPAAGSLTTCSVTTTWARCGPQGSTLTAAAYSLRLGFDARAGSGNTGTSAGVTIYAWGAQAEIGAYRTSPIVTAASTVARNADSVTVAKPASLTDAQGCVVASVTPLPGIPTSSHNGRVIGNSLASNDPAPLFVQDRTHFGVWDGTTPLAALATLDGTAAVRGAGCWGPGGLSVRNVTTGAAATTGSYDGTMFGAQGTLFIGAESSANNFLSGSISDLRVCKTGTFGQGGCK